MNTVQEPKQLSQGDIGAILNAETLLLTNKDVRTIFNLKDPRAVWKRIEELGVPVVTVGKRKYISKQKFFDKLKELDLM
jgi:ABC-type hemin transport system substrate-binding protein